MNTERALSVQPFIFISRLHSSGDTVSEREFFASISAKNTQHGNLLELKIESKIERKGSKLFAAVQVTSKVTKGDLTEFSSICKEIEIFNAQQRCSGWSIKSVNSNTTFDLTIADPIFYIKVDEGVRVDERGVCTYFPSVSSLVSFYQIIGDRCGSNDNVITAIFKPVELLLQQDAQ